MDDTERAAIYRLHAEFCKVLSDANRLMMITELARGESSVNDLTKKLGLHQSNVSKHLSLMRDHGLVQSRRDGSTIYYRLSDPRICDAINLLIEAQAGIIEERRALASGR